MSLQSARLSFLVRSSNYGRFMTLRIRLWAALGLVGGLPVLTTAAVGRLPWWSVVPGLVLVALLSAYAVRLLILPIADLRSTVARATSEDFNVRASIPSGDEIGDIAAAFDDITRRAQSFADELEVQRVNLGNDIIHLFGELSRAANGDLTVRPALGDSSLAPVADSVSVLIKRFGAIVRDIQNTAMEMGDGATQVASAVQQVAHEAGKQAAALNKSACAIGDLAASASSVSERTQAAMKVSGRALEAVRTGHDAVIGAHDTMSAIRDTTRRATRKVKGLGESAQLMSQALTLVQRNTEELHIMAGNASIEASRHAENSNIFRAVADGIEAVAEQSQLALRQIQEVIERNQRETVGVVEAIEDVTSQVVTGARMVQRAADSFTVVDGVVHELADLNIFIASASAAQAMQAVEVTALMGTLNSISVETSRNTATSAEATVRLRQLTEHLSNSVAALKAG